MNLSEALLEVASRATYGSEEYGREVVQTIRDHSDALDELPANSEPDDDEDQADEPAEPAATPAAPAKKATTGRRR